MFFTDTLLRSAEEVMPGQIRQTRLSGSFEDTAMRAEFVKAWTERQEVRTACRKLRGVMQVAKDRHLEVYSGKLEEFTKAGDMRG